MRKEKGKFFVSSQSNSRAGLSNKVDKTIKQPTKSSMSEQERIELMGTNLKKFTDGGMCRGAGAAIKGTKFKGVF